MALRIERVSIENDLGGDPAQFGILGQGLSDGPPDHDGSGAKGKRRTHKGWVLSPQAFDRLLSAFHDDRERAGEEYEKLRRVLVTFFDWRGCRSPEELADETFNRVARRLEEGEVVRNVADYCHGVARRLVFEAIPAQNKLQDDPDDFQHISAKIEDPDELQDRERRYAAFERCLGKLSDEDRALVIGYYQTEKRAKIDNRVAIAQSLGVNLNSLRVRVHRIRAKLEDCITNCLGTC
ncbi:MAG: sigma-70 family RNA polymerase sigma factor [Blastocatellia bacterium]|nr:sigma-70 family RNA polymerase sigma factor [Blastocatellia bacterium]